MHYNKHKKSVLEKILDYHSPIIKCSIILNIKKFCLAYFQKDKKTCKNRVF